VKRRRGEISAASNANRSREAKNARENERREQTPDQSGIRMLHTPKLPLAPAQDAAADISAAATFTAVKQTIGRQWPTMLYVVLLVFALAAIYFFTAQPKYTATAELYVDTHKIQLMQQQQTLDVDAPVDSSLIDSQVEILKSENIALAVIKDMHLLDDPEFTGPAGGLVGAVFGLIGRLIPGAEAPPSEYAMTRQAVARFAKGLTIKRLGLSYVMEIDFQSTDAQRAAQIANAIADAYVVDSLEAKYQSSRRAATWLQDRLKELRAQASDAERAVVQYKASNNIVDTGGRLLNEQQLAELDSALTAAQAVRSEAEARVQRIQTILHTVDQSGISADTATVTDTLHNDVITRLRQQYLDLAEREADWSVRYGPEHLAVVNLKDQMLEIRRSVGDELKRIAETYQSDLDIARSHEASIKESLDKLVAQSNQTSEAEVRLHELDSNAQSYRALTDNFLQLYMVSVQQQSFPVTESRLITEATAPLRPSSPKLFLVIALALVGGSLLAFAIATFRELADRVVRVGSQIESALGVECLAVAPFFKPAKGDAALAPVLDLGARTFTSKGGMLSYVVDSPFSRFAEALRAVKVAIDLRGLDKPNTVIGLTSSLPNEGKSTLAAAMAHLIARSGSKVIFVDCDLRNPSVTKHLTPVAEVGVVEVIVGRVKLEDAIWTDTVTGLKFLPAAHVGRNSQTSELLSSPQAEALFAELRKTYDYVIVDLSPLAPVVDVRATSRFIDSYLLVVEWSRTKIDVAEHALGAARNVHDSVMGAILNKVNMKTMRRYEGYRGVYYGNRYYKRYGYSD
jgi:succinoglycan biosynthesis transport protein ExoP